MKSLPRSLDVTITLTKAQTEISTDMSLMCILVPSASFLEADRVKYYETFEAFEVDYPSNTSAYWAGMAFFGRSDRPARLAVGLIPSADQPGKIISGVIATADIDPIKAVTTGSMKLTIGASEVSITAMDFSSATDLEDIATAIAAGTGFPSGATVVANADGTLTISSGTSTGDTVIAAYAAEASAGVYVGTLLKLTAATNAVLSQGHTMGELVDEAAIVQTVSTALGYPVYGWALERTYRDTANQQAFASWVNAQSKAFSILVTNLSTAYSTVDTANIGYYCNNNNLDAVGVLYHDDSQYYPDVSYIAMMLAVDYDDANSAITAKFKEMSGIPTVDLTSTELAALVARRINTYTLIGNGSETIRDGIQSADDWYSDQVVDLDNFTEELQTEVYNVFLRNKKVPYTPAGQMLIVSACQKICQKYVTNGVFDDRPVTDPTTETGVSILPAFSVVPQGIETATASMRAARLGPPVQITAYLAGAIHKITVNINAIE